MIDVKSLSVEELNDLSSVIKKELDYRRQRDVDNAIEDFKRAFNHLRELHVEIQYSSDEWGEDIEYLRDWDGFNFY